MSGSWIPIEPRSLSDGERALLVVVAPSATDAALDSLRATERCTCGCLSVGFESEGPARVSGEAFAADADGVSIYVMFFTGTDGRPFTFEVMRADGRDLQAMPPPEAVTEVRTVSDWGVDQTG